jgi:hypothetical protein
MPLVSAKGSEGVPLGHGFANFVGHCLFLRLIEQSTTILKIRVTCTPTQPAKPMPGEDPIHLPRRKRHVE